MNLDHVRGRLTRQLRRSRRLRQAYVRYRISSLSSTEPIDHHWGLTRGTPVDRWYIERFLEAHRSAVKGHVLEVMSDHYATRYGATTVEIVDIDADNPEATIVADLCSDPLPASTYDAIILTQTLQLLAQPALALANLHQALKPGATMLLTAPAVSRLANENDRWRWTPRGLRELLDAAGTPGEVSGAGNALVCRAFLAGLSTDDLDPAALVVDDPTYVLLIMATVTRSPGSSER